VKPLLLLATIVLAAAPIAAPARSDDEVRYVLTAESAWLEGCIVGVCLCPAIQFDDLTGDFALFELPTLQPGPWRLFEVRDVHWTLGRGDARIAIRGSGLYRTAAPMLDQQRLVLDLELDGEAIETLDSGLVADALFFPKIDIQALTPGDCFQKGVRLVAAPVPEPSPVLQQMAALLALAALVLSPPTWPAGRPRG